MPSASAASVPGRSATCSWHFSAVWLRYGSMATSFAPRRFASCARRPEVQVGNDRIAAPDQDQPAVLELLDVGPHRRADGRDPAGLAGASRRWCGRAATRRAGGRSGDPSSRIAGGPSFPRRSTGRSPAGRRARRRSRRTASAIVSSASSQEMRSKRPSPFLPTRLIGCSTRSVGVGALEVARDLGAQRAGGRRMVRRAAHVDRAAVLDRDQHRAGVRAVVRAGAAHDGACGKRVEGHRRSGRVRVRHYPRVGAPCGQAGRRAVTGSARSGILGGMAQRPRPPTCPSVTFPDGTTVPALGLGTWTMGEREARAADGGRGARARLRSGHDAGRHRRDVRATAAPEEVVARAIAGRRDRLFVVSKVYPHNAGRKSAISACERSLAAARHRSARSLPAALAGADSAGRNGGCLRAAARRRQDRPLGRLQFRHRRHARTVRARRRAALRDQSGPLPSGRARHRVGAAALAARAPDTGDGVFARWGRARCCAIRSWRRSRDEAERRRRRSRWAGCCDRRTSWPSRNRPTSSTSAPTGPRRRCGSTRRRSTRSTRRFRRRRAPRRFRSFERPTLRSRRGIAAFRGRRCARPRPARGLARLLLNAASSNQR